MLEPSPVDSIAVLLTLSPAPWPTTNAFADASPLIVIPEIAAFASWAIGKNWKAAGVLSGLASWIVNDDSPGPWMLRLPVIAGSSESRSIVPDTANLMMSGAAGLVLPSALASAIAWRRVRTPAGGLASASEVTV